MGSNNSVPRKYSNEEILANINKLFNQFNEKKHEPLTIHSLSLEKMDNENVVPRQSRYVEFEKQLGGAICEAQATKLLALAGGSCEPKNCKCKCQNGGNDDEDGNISESSLNMDMDEDMEENNVLEGGCAACGDTTSDMFMSEILKMNNVSSTSHSPQYGGCGCDDKVIPAIKNTIMEPDNSVSSLSLTFNTTPVSPKVQKGGCPACTMKTSELVGGAFNKQSSEGMNIMPFYSSTSGTEYYSNMQREHRYT